MIQLILLLLLVCPLFGEIRLDGLRIQYQPNRAIKEELVLAKKAWEAGNLRGALASLEAILASDPPAEEASFCQMKAARCLFLLGEYEEANEFLSAYLRSQGSPDFFKEALDLKFAIAEKFRSGSGRPLFGIRYMPKILGGELNALEIYDEIATTVPSDPLAANALLKKGILLNDQGKWREGVESLQALIRRFPKDPMAIEAYVLMGKIFRDISLIEVQNPDILGLAKINLKRFKTDFPQDDRINEVESHVLQVEEAYANALFDSGSFYERRGEALSAQLYYENAIHLFPQTKVAQLSQTRLEALGKSSSSLTIGK